MMAARRFSLVMMLGAATLFASTVAANVLLDPEQVFGTKLFPRNVNWNERVGKLALYKSEATGVDGLLFSSSRGNLLDRNLLAKDMGVWHLLSMSVSFGMVTDHLPIFEYILRDKAARGERIKAVTLLLDPDFFGKPPWTNSNINSFLPPELTGESAARYWWRYLTVFQFRLWRDVWRSARTDSTPKPVERPTEIGALGGTTAPAPQRMPQVDIPKTDTVVTEPIPAAARAPTSAASEEYRRAFNSVRPDLERQIGVLKRFAELCRENNVKLTVAMSPLIQQNLEWHEPGMIDALTQRLSTVVPLWDFNSPPLIAGRKEYWLDFSHFNANAGTMMINRMFGSKAEPLPIADFGKPRGY